MPAVALRLVSHRGSARCSSETRSTCRPRACSTAGLRASLAAVVREAGRKTASRVGKTERPEDSRRNNQFRGTSSHAWHPRRLRASASGAGQYTHHVSASTSPSGHLTSRDLEPRPSHVDTRASGGCRISKHGGPQAPRRVLLRRRKETPDHDPRDVLRSDPSDDNN